MKVSLSGVHKAKEAQLARLGHTRHFDEFSFRIAPSLRLGNGKASPKILAIRRVAVCCQNSRQDFHARFLLCLI
jgi:hypothetical protein